MRFLSLLLIGALVVPATSEAGEPQGCGGTDFVAALAASDPAAHAAFFERAHEVPNGVGKFWRVEKPGAAPSYVFGTFHVVEATRLALTRKVLEALDDARALVVEVDASAQGRGAAPTRSLQQAYEPLGTRLGPELTAKAAAVLAPRGIDMASLDNATPFEVLVRLEVMPCLFEGGPVMDTLLQDWARRARVPVIGLEEPGAAYAAFAGIGDRDGWELVRETIRQYAAIPPQDSFEASLALYLADETQAMLDLGRLMSERAGSDPGHARHIGALLTEHLMTQRNLDWIGRLAPELERGGVFVAVGAGHLPGDNGLMALIQRKGFTITRLDAGAPAPGGIEALAAGRRTLVQ